MPGSIAQYARVTGLRGYGAATVVTAIALVVAQSLATRYSLPSDSVLRRRTAFNLVGWTPPRLDRNGASYLGQYGLLGGSHALSLCRHLSRPASRSALSRDRTPRRAIDWRF